MPEPAIASVALNEVLVHGWDLAVASRQTCRPDDVAQECLTFAQQFADAALGPRRHLRAGRAGARRRDGV